MKGRASVVVLCVRVRAGSEEGNDGLGMALPSSAVQGSATFTVLCVRTGSRLKQSGDRWGLAMPSSAVKGSASVVVLCVRVRTGREEILERFQILPLYGIE